MSPVPTKIYVFLFLILLIANLGLYRSVFTQKELSIETVPAGKGSVTLIRTIDRKIIVIDAGSDASVLRALGGALPPWKRDIDLLLLRGVSGKESGGAPDILARYKVATLARPTAEESKTWEGALAAAASAETKLIHVEQGSVLSLGDISISITTTPGKTPATVVVSDGKTEKTIK